MNPLTDVVADGPDALERLGGRIVERPVVSALPWHVRALVAVPHRDQQRRLRRHGLRQLLWHCRGQVDARFPHCGYDNRIHLLGRPSTRRDGARLRGIGQLLRRRGAPMSGVSVGHASPHDLAAMEALLAASQLPTAGLRDSIATALVARIGNRTIGCVALEVYPSGVLLRSVAVDNAWRGRGIGHQLTSAGLDLARSLGAETAYLLTTTAGDFFPRLDFAPVERAAVPDDVKQSIEFRSACPSSALAMRAALNRHVHAVSLPGHRSWEGR